LRSSGLLLLRLGHNWTGDIAALWWIHLRLACNSQSLGHKSQLRLLSFAHPPIKCNIAVLSSWALCERIRFMYHLISIFFLRQKCRSWVTGLKCWRGRGLWLVSKPFAKLFPLSCLLLRALVNWGSLCGWKVKNHEGCCSCTRLNLIYTCILPDERHNWVSCTAQPEKQDI
jgi:hypothetical protein